MKYRYKIICKLVFDRQEYRHDKLKIGDVSYLKGYINTIFF